MVFDIPNGIDIAVDKQTHITVTGVDRQLVGQVAANIRRMRKPDPYKQKGVRYTGEVVEEEGRQDRSEVDGLGRLPAPAPRGPTYEDQDTKTIAASGSAIAFARRVSGTVERPRLTVFRSVSHMYVQVVDDASGQTIASASTVEPAVKGALPKKVTGGNVAGAKAIGKTIAERLHREGREAGRLRSQRVSVSRSSQSGS